MVTLDIFNNDAFSMASLTARVNKLPFAPGKVGRLGIFDEAGVTTTTVDIEEYSGTLSLLPNVPRGGPNTQNKHAKRILRALTVPHLPLDDTVMASEIQNVRGFGNESELQGVSDVVDLRLMEMNRKHDATIEYQRVGAVKGLLLDADGTTVIYNLFTEFGVSQTSIDFDLGTATSSPLGNIMTMAGAIEDELGAQVYNHIQVLAGKTWWSKFIQHPKVINAYQYFQATGQTQNPLRQDLRYAGFTFGNVVWDQYRGNVGGVAFIADSEAYAFPVGVPGLFITRFAPADFMETVNTPGLPRYVKQAPDPSGLNRWRLIHTQSNPISMNTRPKTSIKLTTST